MIHIILFILLSSLFYFPCFSMRHADDRDSLVKQTMQNNSVKEVEELIQQLPCNAKLQFTELNFYSLTSNKLKLEELVPAIKEKHTTIVKIIESPTEIMTNEDIDDLSSTFARTLRKTNLMGLQTKIEWFKEVYAELIQRSYQPDLNTINAVSDARFRNGEQWALGALCGTVILTGLYIDQTREEPSFITRTQWPRLLSWFSAAIGTFAASLFSVNILLKSGKKTIEADFEAQSSYLKQRLKDKLKALNS